MSTLFMFFIAACYITAAGTFAYEQKYMWMGVCIAWGVGNALIGILSAR